MKQFKIIFFISILLFSFFQCYSQTESSSLEEQEQAEKIKQFHADIQIKENGNIIVTETIKVYAAQLEIDHGIFRELPMKNYSSKVARNNFYTVLNVSKDGMNEPFHIDIDADKFTIYIGDKDSTLNEGTYTYKLTYEVEAQVHSYADFDEIYWNITGNYWVFDIDNVTARVILPKSAEVLQTHCYTGVLGSKANECNAKIIGNSVYFNSKNLKKEEGFTVAVGFPKGIVHQPSFLPHYKMEEFLSFEKTGVGLLAVLICFLFYFFSWKTYGKDPLVSTDNEILDLKNLYSAPALQYIKEKYSNSQTLLAAIISLSIKGAIEIACNGKEDWQDGFEYFLKKGTNRTNLSKEENAVLETLFKENDTFSINSKSYLIFDLAEKALEKSLMSEYNLKDYFLGNTKQILIGFAVTIATIIGYCYYTRGTILGWVIFGFICFVFTAFLIKVIIKSISKGEYGVAIPCLFVIVFPSVFGYASFFAINVDKNYSALNVLILFLIITGFTIYLSLINSYTKLGITTELQIEKFKEQLLNYSVEQNTNTIRVYEENLPYAFALDIQEEWNLKFVGALKNLNYTSNWIKSSDGSSGFSSRVLIHFNDSYNAMSTSSSSGSSGGGSSGGGGGGGGGGGW
jgi:uncharacterized membrane protein YgcG